MYQNIYPIACGLPATVPIGITGAPAAGLGENFVLCLEICYHKIVENKTEYSPFFAFPFYAFPHLKYQQITKIRLKYT